MQYFTHTLSNGLRLVHLPDNSPVSYCGFAINAGTRDELSSQHGIAHFIEHMLFKGTKHRKAWHILNSMETEGGELNAYTTKEETFVYAVFLETAIEKAVDLLADMVGNSIFPQKEMGKESDIILDEIESYNDSPSELIFDEFEQLLFDSYPIGRNILGSPESISTFTQSDLVTFHTAHYHSERMVFFSFGKTDFQKIIRLGEKYLTAIPVSTKPYIRTPPQVYIPKNEVFHKETHQEHYILGNRAYSLSHPNRTAFYLLNNILGGPGMNSLLNLSLRERSGLVYQIESNYTPYTDTGTFTIYYGTDPKNHKKCHALVYKELDKLKDKPLSEKSLVKAKHQLMGQLAIASENKESIALSFGRSLLQMGTFESLNDIMTNLQHVTVFDLQKLAQEIFDDNQLTSLLYHD
ncbi:M16 family metallopeptidase [Microbacter margulisiae]|uniref:Putative Zn-dependent peptidase n=1 Tax=Microbacter margulisiae TaxID=1350067 RepID=A0A7W5H251_9PORP|nr:pitrilysin family protein [Microbacter margulisiae]MBB3187052.1 putative Zn-dependent peptidase [Microbacter margulisiae]